MSVQFDRLTSFSYVHVGALWERFKERFPDVSYQPPLAPSFETFDLPQSGAPEFQLQFGSVPELPRLWFVDPDNVELVQFQPDRFIHNWRKTGDAVSYPRYEVIRERFITEMEILREFALENNLGNLVPNQCEITYINTIPCRDRTPSSPEGIFRWWADLGPTAFGDLESAGVQVSYLIPDSDGQPIGRIWVQSSPAIGPQGERIQMLSLVGRGPPASPSFDAVLEFFDNARSRIVRGFADITSSDMHTTWGRET